MHKCIPSCVHSCILTRQNTPNFGVDMFGPWVCAAYCSIHCITLRALGILTCRERGSQAMWCINEELWLHKSELSTHIIFGFPPLTQSVRHVEGQESVIFLDLVGRLKKIKIKPCEWLPDSCRHYLAAAISDKRLMCRRVMSLFCLLIQFIPTLNIKIQSRAIFHFPSIPVLKEVGTMLMVTLQGLLERGKHQITLIRTVGCSQWVGSSQMVVSCVWCV